MPRQRPIIDLDDYRSLVALDVPIRHVAPIEPGSRASAVCTLIEALAADGTAETLGVEPDAVEQLERDEVQSRRLLRALLTARDPEHLSDRFVSEMDGLLQLELRERGHVEVESLTRIGDAFPNTSYPTASHCALWQGDITRLGTDAIVNAANSQMLGCFVPFHACIDNAIHSAAGPRLREDCALIMSRQGTLEPTGTAKATRAYNLPARFVLHTVGPIVEGKVEESHQTALASCYRACLDLAARLPNVRSVAFCGISTGVFGYPKGPAARVALWTVAEWLHEHSASLDLVVFNVFGDEDLAIYQATLAAWKSPPDDQVS